MPARFGDRPRPRGAWSSATAYTRGDLVNYGGSTWIALTPSTNHTPVEGAYWSLFASKGDTGATGATGSTGSTGAPGSAATVTVGSTTTGAAGSSASVTNSGTTSAAVLNFTVPAGATGPAGTAGTSGVITVNSPLVNSGTSTAANLSLTTGTPNGVAPLDGDGKVPNANLPALAITNTWPVSSQAAMLALDAQVGDIAVRTDLSKSYILTTSPATTLANWQELLTPPDAVTSVDGQTGAVNLTSTYAPLASPTFTGTVTAASITATGDLSVAGAIQGHKVIVVGNNTGSTITKGSAVYISGGTGDVARISLAQANSEATSSRTLGIAYEDIANGSTTGRVLTEGYLDGIDTSAAGNVGDPVYLSPTTAGGLVYGLSNKPSAPNHLVFIGVVARKQVNNGRLFVKVQNGFELDELHSVDLITSAPTNGQVLTYDSSTSLWRNQSISESQVTNLVTDLAGKASTTHTHIATDITSGTLDIARIPTGTTNTTVSLGDHTHTPASIGAASTTHTHAQTDITNLTTDLSAKAPLASPALTGTPTVPTAAVDTNTTQAASTAFVVGQAGSTAPLVNGTPTVGTSTRYARADHVHPTDTTRLSATAAAGGDLTGNYPNPSLKNTGTAGAQQPKVTTDAQGRVISSTALAASDIPSLDASKITTGAFTGAFIPQIPVAGVAQWTSGKYWLNNRTQGQVVTQTTAPGDGFELAVPIAFAFDVSITSITVRVGSTPASGGGGGRVVLGIRNSNASGEPGTVLREASSLTTTVATQYREATFTTPATLNAYTLYWLCACPQGAPTTNAQFYYANSPHLQTSNSGLTVSSNVGLVANVSNSSTLASITFSSDGVSRGADAFPCFWLKRS